jgi:hypothetical protein
MPNDYTGRVWRIVEADTTPFGLANVKFKGGLWSGSMGGETFIITDADGRVYTFSSDAAGAPVNFYELGWLSGPLSFSGTFTGEVDLYLGTK